MKVPYLFTSSVLTAVLILGTGLATDKAGAVAQQGPADLEAGMQVLTRGPVHEAFAEPVVFAPQPGIVATKAPPAPIDEVPPEVKPEAAVWIPGYWAWDDEQQDFLWVSGFWRIPPAERQWVPGYWAQTTQGYRWVAGYWTRAQVTEMEYLPQPPASIETGPTVPALSPDYVWIPGVWVWHHGGYAWRPGYWAVARPDWVWVPAHYVWAPPGYVFIEGYWDYDIDHRGILFAPVRFGPNAYARPGFRYSPSIVINLSVLTRDLFVRPYYSHYYFGDYYAPHYDRKGFYASFVFESKRHGYDPIYLHERWRHRGDRDWEHRLRAEFQYRREHEAARPPRTLTALRDLLASNVGAREKTPVIAAPLDQVVKRRPPPLHLQPLAEEQKREAVQREREVHTFREERRKLESTAVSRLAERSRKEASPARLKLPKSPIRGKSHPAVDGVPTLPKAHETPRPEPKSSPRPVQPRDEPKDKPKGESKGKTKE